MPRPSPPKWPAGVRLNFYNRHGAFRWSDTYRRLDLFDTLVLNSEQTTITAYLGVLTTSAKWTRWSNAALERVEDIIRDDFGFDCYRVKLTRVTPVGRGGRPQCSKEFKWKLQLRPCW